MGHGRQKGARSSPRQPVAVEVRSGDVRKPDLLVLNSVNGYLTTLLNTGIVSFSPTTPLNFKKQAVGTTSGPQTVTLTNTARRS